MRLLNVHTILFEEFEVTIPKYAIASHRWIEDQEVTLRDVQGGAKWQSSGHSKLLGLRKFVRENCEDVDWLWIDTCCIDKSDHAELTEAINSMFEWYRNAHICLAYLADVPLASDLERFRKSQWFKRGWTLQELLAPRTVVFLAQDWSVVGYKGYVLECCLKQFPVKNLSLESIVAQITDIPEAALHDYHESQGLSLGEKLSWKRGRSTTRPEDNWYSLIGILDAKLVVKYGEGEANAERRLLEDVKKDDQAIQSLQVANGAAFDDRRNEQVSACLPGTRVDILGQIADWSLSSSRQCIFWLSGMAGTGKSTIFKSVARLWNDQHRVLASFCFKRGEAGRDRAALLFTSLAVQLAQKSRGVKRSILIALRHQPDLQHKGLKEQFEKLILAPLEHATSQTRRAAPWVIGIDALDECDDDDDIEFIIYQLARLSESLSGRVRLLITSRPEWPIRLSFSKLRPQIYHNLSLEHTSQVEIAHDITLYFQHQLAEVRAQACLFYGRPELQEDWPSAEDLQTLVDMSQPLFIFAATITRLLLSFDDHPRETLKLVLRHRVDPLELDRTYLPVLEHLLIGKSKRVQERIAGNFKEIVGSIITLADPLSVSALAIILGISDYAIFTHLSKLHSVIDGPSSPEDPRAVRILHLSFRDYLLDSETRYNSSSFWIDELHMHKRLATRCIGLLRSGALKRDICNVREFSVRRMSIDKTRIQQCLPEAVVYACRYWIHHLTRSGPELAGANGITLKFLQEHLLHWIEAMSWQGKTADVIHDLAGLQNSINVSRDAQLYGFVSDASRFVLRNRAIIDEVPLQVYLSALMFSPSQSILRCHFLEDLHEHLVQLPEVPEQWSAERLQLEGHEKGVNFVAISADGMVAASSSDDETVRLWSTITGEQILKLEGHQGGAGALAMSANGKTIASGSNDRVIRIWSATTGEQTLQLRGHQDRISAVALSADGRIVASGSHDCTVRLWSCLSGEQILQFNGHQDKVSAIALSPDGQVVASGSHDRTTRLWSCKSGEQVLQFDGHVDKVSTVALSADGRILVSGSCDQTVRLWSTHSGQQVRLFEGHGDNVNVVALSADGKVIASASDDKSARVWSALSGTETLKLTGYEDRVSAVALSADGQTMVSSSPDNAVVGLWITTTGGQKQELNGHKRWVSAITISADGRVVASGSLDRTVRLWLAASGEEILQLEGHEDKIGAVALSADGKVVASGSDDRTVRLWSGTTGKHLLLFRHEDKLSAVALSPNGQILASCSYDRTVRLWSTVHGELTNSFGTHTHLTTLNFSSDGTGLDSNLGHFNIRLPCDGGHAPPGPDNGVIHLKYPWIKYRNSELLWLPFEYRGSCYVTHGNVLVIGQASGAMTFFSFK